MTELESLRRLQKRVPVLPGSGIILGIGDDCAIFRPAAPGEELLFTTDLMIEEVHFLPSAPAAAVGHKTLARGLSDIAAMGGTPRFCLLSLAAGERADTRWIERFYDGLLALSRKTRVTLAGGDLARAEKTVCDIVVCGSVPRGAALRRTGARAGDAIYVTGELGGSALGLEKRRGAAWQRHLHPEPRLAAGRFVRERLQATAAMDLSDGLSLDLHRLCLASGVTARLDRPLPVFPGAGIEQALHGGEDYELMFTVRPGVRVPARHQGIALTQIGTIEKAGGRQGKAGRIEFFGLPLKVLGYDHFRRP